MKTRTRSYSAKPNDSTNLSPLPTLEETRQRAHQIFLARGSTPGNELDDWLRAEQELKRERTGAETNTPQK